MTEGRCEAAIWHDVECGAYDADLPLWRSLAREAEGAVLDVGAGTGRVTLDLARHGHPVTAVDRDAELLAVLRERADDLPVETVVADARRLSLERRFGVCIVPMQTIQLLGGQAGRRNFLTRARSHLRSGSTLAAAIAEDLPAFEPDGPGALPAPDVRERDGWVYASQPVAVRDGPQTTILERLRQAVAPDGTRTACADLVALDRLGAGELEREGEAAGFEVLSAVEVPPTADHAASRVVMLRA